MDEILVTDPDHYRNLADLARCMDSEVITAFGSDILHLAESEPPIDLTRKISLQRTWFRPFWSLCKPSLTSRPIRWGHGFHYADTRTIFRNLFLFHLAYVDAGIIERRQRKRNAAQPVGKHGSHHAIPPENMVRHIARDYAALPKRRGVTLSPLCPAFAAFTSELFAGDHRGHGGRMISSGPHADELWALPERFVGRF